MNPDKPKVNVPKGELASALANAEKMCSYAEQEPRWHKTPWRLATFKQSLQTGFEVRFILHGMHSVAGCSGDTIENASQDTKPEKLLMALRIKEVKSTICDRPMVRIRYINELMAVFDQERDQKSKEFLEAEEHVVRDFRHTYRGNLEAAIAACNKDGRLSISSMAETLECDHVAQISFQLAAARTVVDMVRSLADDIIRMDN